MGKLLLTLIRFLLEKSRWLLLIVLVLLAGAWLRSEWQLVEKTKQQQQALQQNQQLLQQRHQQLKIAQAQIAQQTQRLTQQLSEKNTPASIISASTANAQTTTAAVMGHTLVGA